MLKVILGGRGGIFSMCVKNRRYTNYHIFSNLIRTSFCRFLKQKKKLVRGSNPHLSFNRPLPTRQTDSVMSDDGESDE